MQKIIKNNIYSINLKAGINLIIKLLLEVILGLCLSLFLISCSTVDSQAQYTSNAPRGSDTLVTPPGLNSPDLTTNYKMASAKDTQVGYQAVNIQGMQIIGGGNERWLVIESQTVNNLMPKVIAFINQIGLSVKYQNPAIGVIQTDWANKNSKVPQGVGIRGFFSWVGWDSMYSLNSMYMYRLLLWQDGNKVVLMATNYEMDETYEGCGNQSLSTTSTLASSDSQRTKWISRPSSPQLELEFLSQFMAFAGMPEVAIKKQVTTVANAPKEASLVNNQVIVQDVFDRAWWRTAIALDRVGLGVVDKDHSRGEYYVYPLQSQIDSPDPGVFAKWFGKSSESATKAGPKPLYTVKLTPQGNTTLITIGLYDSQSIDKNFANNQKKYLTGLASQLQ